MSDLPGKPQEPKWFDYIQVREKRLLGTRQPPTFVVSFGPTNICKEHHTAEYAQRQVDAIKRWITIHMQASQVIPSTPSIGSDMADQEIGEQ